MGGDGDKPLWGLVGMGMISVGMHWDGNNRTKLGPHAGLYGDLPQPGVIFGKVSQLNKSQKKKNKLVEIGILSLWW